MTVPKAALLLVVALGQAEAPSGQRASWATRDSSARHLRVQRAVQIPAGSSGPTCAVLDAAVYAHAEGESLNDLRLFAAGSGAELPFVLTESNTERTESEPAEVRHVRMRGRLTQFDLEMPKRPYTAVTLDLEARNLVGTATVSARDAEGHPVALGQFAIFDLSARHLSRSTTLPLQESSFAELHVQLDLRAAPGSAEQAFGSGIVRGVSVPPSRAAQTVYTPVAGTSAWTQRGQDSVATVRLPAHVPVARVRVTLAPGYEANFLREVIVAAKPDHAERAEPAESDVETVSSDISQVHLSPAQSGIVGAIDDRRLAVDAVLAANLRGPATVQISVVNGGEAPLPLRTVQLEMRERRICFEANASARGYILMYGDNDLPAPVYDTRRVFAAAAEPLMATLRPEQPNPDFVPRANARSLEERHPDLLWLSVLAALSAVGGMMMRGVRHRRGGLR